MKNKQSGFASILLVILVLVGVGGGAYFYTKQKNEIKIVDTSLSTDVQGTSTMATTTEVKSVSKTTLSDAEFLKVVPEGRVLAKGDIDLNGTLDAIILDIQCGASCGASLQVVFNKNGKAELLTSSTANFSPAFYGASAAKSAIPDITIKNGIITLTGQGLDCMKGKATEVDYCSEEKWNISKSVTYKFNGKDIVQLSVTQQSQPESFKKQPVKILSIKDLGNNTWSVQADVLTYNPDWTPGGRIGLYLNQNSKIRTLIISKNTKVNTCNHDGTLLLPTTTSLVSDITKILNNGSQFILPMDIEGSKIMSTYEECSS